MIVVTGSARTGTSLMMRILKAFKVPVHVSKFSDDHKDLEQYNPLGFFEDGELNKTGVQSDKFKGMAVKLFGYALSVTPKKYVLKVIVCRRNRADAAESSKPVYEKLYAKMNIINKAKGFEYAYYDLHYKQIEDYVQDVPHLEVHLESMKANPGKEIEKISKFIGRKINSKDREKLLNSIERI